MPELLLPGSELVGKHWELRELEYFSHAIITVRIVFHSFVRFVEREFDLFWYNYDDAQAQHVVEQALSP